VLTEGAGGEKQFDEADGLDSPPRSGAHGCAAGPFSRFIRVADLSHEPKIKAKRWLCTQRVVDSYALDAQFSQDVHKA
jgi:hypothetical protein